MIEVIKYDDLKFTQIRIGKAFVLSQWSTGLFWIRVFGYGFHAKDLTRNRLLFSERIGKTKILKIGKWGIKALRPGN